MNCPVCSTDVSVGARTCPRCGYEFSSGAAPDEQVLRPGYMSGAWPSVTSPPPDERSFTPPDEPDLGTAHPSQDSSFGHQTDTWPVIAAAVPPPHQSYTAAQPTGGAGADRRGQALSRPVLAGAAVVCVLIAGAVFWKTEHHTSSAAGASSPTSSIAGRPDPIDPSTIDPSTAAPDPTIPAPSVPTTTDPGMPTPAPDSTPPGKTAEYTQLMVIERLLTTSANSRTQLHHALGQDCKNVRSAEASLQQVLSQRQQEIDAANALDVSQVPDGDELQSDLVSMLTYSLQADQAYDQSERDLLSYGCGTGDGDYQRGQDISVNEAQPAKTQFFAIWTPLAVTNAITPVHSTNDV